MKLQDTQIMQFQEVVWEHYHTAGRSMPWRDNPDPYWVLVSEIMLQQTQVSRVLPKFREFIARFPSITDVAAAPLGEVLRAWSGLGYNRRAKFLHQAAKLVAEQFGGAVPNTLDQLVTLPGVGVNTAGAIAAYAYNQPVIFIETNIRTVFFHHFFADQENIDDKQLQPFIEQTIDREHPREWYWALMDYGTYLKQAAGNNISRSKHYVRQSAFAGSRRQLRGAVLRALHSDSQSDQSLATALNDDRLTDVVQDLLHEGLIRRDGGLLKLADLP